MPRVCNGAASALPSWVCAACSFAASTAARLAAGAETGLAPSNWVAMMDVSWVRLMVRSFSDTADSTVPSAMVAVTRKGALAPAVIAILAWPLASVPPKPTLSLLAS